jgi:hypothetical protein
MQDCWYITINKLGPMPLHNSIQIQFQWNVMHAIPSYIGCNEKECDNATFLTT